MPARLGPGSTNARETRLANQIVAGLWRAERCQVAQTGKFETAHTQLAYDQSYRSLTTTAQRLAHLYRAAQVGLAIAFRCKIRRDDPAPEIGFAWHWRFRSQRRRPPRADPDRLGAASQDSPTDPVPGAPGRPAQPIRPVAPFDKPISRWCNQSRCRRPGTAGVVLSRPCGSITPETRLRDDAAA